MNTLEIVFTEPILLYSLYALAGLVGAIFLLFIIRLCRLGVKKLSFDTNGGEKIKPKKIRKGKRVLLEKLPRPKKENDEFIEWCENISLTKPLQSFIMPNADKKVYVKWQSDIDAEKERQQLEKRKVVKKERPNDNKFDMPDISTIKFKEEPKKEVKPELKPEVKVEAKPEVKVEAKPEVKVESKKEESYQYEFKKKDASQTYAYSKFNQELQDSKEKQKQEEMKLRNYEKLNFIATELHFSIDSLKDLDERNIEILYKKAEKAKYEKDREEYIHQRQINDVHRKQNEYSKPKPEGVAGLGGTVNYNAKPVQNESVAKKVEEKPQANEYEKYNAMFKDIEEEVVEEADEVIIPSVEDIKNEAVTSDYVQEQNVNNNDDFEDDDDDDEIIFAEEQRVEAPILEEKAEDAVEPVTEPVVEPVKEPVTEPVKEEVKEPTIQDEKVKKLDELNKNIDKLTQELDNVISLLIQSIKK